MHDIIDFKGDMRKYNNFLKTRQRDFSDKRIILRTQ